MTTTTTWRPPTHAPTASYGALVTIEIRRYAMRRLPRAALASLGALTLAVWFLISPRFVMSVGSQADTAEMLGAPVIAMTVLMMLLLYATAATFIGADSSSGALSQWLTFAPDRTKVFWSKATAVAVCSVIVAGAVLALTMVVAFATFVASGVHVPSILTALPYAARGLVACVLAALGGYAVSAAFGRTAAAPLAIAVYVALFVTRNVLFSAGWEYDWRFGPAVSLMAFLLGGTWVTQHPFHQAYVTWQQGAAILALLVATALLASWAWFCRRDHD